MSHIKPKYSKHANSKIIHINRSDNMITYCGQDLEFMQSAMEDEVKKLHKCKKCIRKREYILWGK